MALVLVRMDMTIEVPMIMIILIPLVRFLTHVLWSLSNLPHLLLPSGHLFDPAICSTYLSPYTHAQCTYSTYLPNSLSQHIQPLIPSTLSTHSPNSLCTHQSSYAGLCELPPLMSPTPTVAINR